MLAIRVILAVVLSTAFLDVPLSAQSVVVATPTGQSLQPASAKTAKVSLNLKNATLEQALRSIAKSAGLDLVYGRAERALQQRVSVNVNNATLAQALAIATRNTRVSASLSPDGRSIIIQRMNSNSAMQGVITGKVTDAKTGKGISGATVSVGDNTSGVTTAEDGSYRLTGVPPGTHTVIVRLIGYAKQTRSVTVGEGATLTADFTLEPSASVLDQVIVTGTVVATELKAVPSAITVVTAKQIEERGITRIDQLFRGEIPGLFAQNMSSDKLDDAVTMFSRGATTIMGVFSAGITFGTNTNPIKTYVDGVEMADPKYLSQIDPKSIERIEILTGPQASTIYGSNALNGVMQVFTKRGSSSRPQLALSLLSGWVENNFSNARTPQHDYNGQLSGVEGRMSYSGGSSWHYMGPWAPAKQTARRGGFGGVRLEMPAGGGSATADVTLRRTDSKTQMKGLTAQSFTGFVETGWYSVTTPSIATPAIITVTGQTFGLTVNYAPTSWWSHEVGIGQDVSDYGLRHTGRGYRILNDTTLQLQQNYTERRSLRYATTTRVPVTSLAQVTVTLGTDAWQNLTTYRSVKGLKSTTGDVSGNAIGFDRAHEAYRYPDHNTGGFLQTQLGIMERLFFTYGLRAEWNPSFGAEAQPNYAPRYGMAYTHELGALTAKLRGSYGRAIRPPASNQKNSRTLSEELRIFEIPDYGDAIVRLANPELAPELQQGGEGGLEFYFGSRGSLVVTRYNQTVDALIDEAKVDSVRSLTNTPSVWDSQDADGYGYLRQYQGVNVGSIRNQGWELQGSVNTGPLTTRGTYSWTKSRTLGVNAKYRALFSNAIFYPQYQPGATFSFLPEHTWAIGVTYARPQTTVALNVNGIGKVMGVNNEFFWKNLNTRIRLPQNRLCMSCAYRGSNTGYALADLTASHRFSARMEGVLQVQNLTDSYTNDSNGNHATIGRQTKTGLRIRM